MNVGTDAVRVKMQSGQIIVRPNWGSRAASSAGIADVRPSGRVYNRQLPE